MSCRSLEVRIWCLSGRSRMSMEPVYPSLSCSSWICEDDKIAQRKGSIFRGQDKKTRYQRVSRERRGRRGDSRWTGSEKEGGRLSNQGRTGLLNANEKVSPWKVVGWFGLRRCRWPEKQVSDVRRPECKGLRIQEVWRELRWRQGSPGRSLTEAGERSIWNVGSEDILLVVWILSLWVRCVWGGEGISLSPSFPSTNEIDLRSWGTDVSQAWSPPLMGLLQSPRGRRHLETHPLMLLNS